MVISKYYLQYCHIPKNTKVSETTCLLCGDDLVADHEWYVWITKDEMDAKIKRKLEFTNDN